MNEFGEKGENIELLLPCNAAYVSAARLTASSIANRLKFALDEIEDIKAAVSEACTYIIKESSAVNKCEFKLTFLLLKDALTITISCSFTIAEQNLENEMGIHMIRALMDSFEIKPKKDGSSLLIMKKEHRADSFY